MALVYSFLIALLLQNLYANAGYIGNIDGQVNIIRNDKVLSAKNGQDIFEKDSLKTFQSKALIYLTDNTRITLGRDSNILIEDYIYKDSSSHVNINFFQGKFRVITGAIGKIAPEKFTIKTNTAIIGIRGTELFGIIKNKYDEIGCLKGSISVKNKHGEVIVNKGFMTRVHINKKPLKPFRINKFILSSLNNYFYKTDSIKQTSAQNALIKNSNIKTNVKIKNINISDKATANIGSVDVE